MENHWTDQRSESALANARTQDIAATLNKICHLSVFTNASPQRREAFRNLQTGAKKKLVPIQDVKTRWNSTFLMLRRAKKLQAFFPPFCAEWQRPDLVLDNEEWRQIDYLLEITHPFYEFTTELSRTRDVTSHYTFKMYNLLFDHINAAITRLAKKRVPWKKRMHAALEAGWVKLKDYYSQTDNIPGDLYAVASMLSPVNKFAFFQSENWEPKYRTQYRQSFKNALQPYQERLPGQQASLSSQTFSGRRS